ncbi:MAG: hypothetical protein QM744_02525 [Mesorhizobium sp.]
MFSHVVPILGDRGFSVDDRNGGGQRLCAGDLRLADRHGTHHGHAPDTAGGRADVSDGGGRTATARDRQRHTPCSSSAGALLGIGLGGQFGALPYFVARYFGTRHFGSVIGAMYSAVIAAQGTTPIVLDAVFDTRHSYRLALLGIGGALIAGALLLTLLPRYGRAAMTANGLLRFGPLRWDVTHEKDREGER